MQKFIPTNDDPDLESGEEKRTVTVLDGQEQPDELVTHKFPTNEVFEITSDKLLPHPPNQKPFGETSPDDTEALVVSLTEADQPSQAIVTDIPAPPAGELGDGNMAAPGNNDAQAHLGSATVAPAKIQTGLVAVARLRSYTKNAEIYRHREDPVFSANNWKRF